MARIRPAAIILDILLQSEESWTLLCQLKESPATRDIPIVVISTVNDAAKSTALGADMHAIKPVERTWLRRTLDDLTTSRSTRVLIVDDQEVMRMVIRQFLDARLYSTIEAETGTAGLVKARSERPGLILLDLGLPDIDGRQVLAELRADPETRSIPVVLVTSARLTSAERQQLEMIANGFLSKDELTRETVNDAALRATTTAPQSGATHLPPPPNRRS
jgi:CheY-like chemotaxis protein